MNKIAFYSPSFLLENKKQKKLQDLIKIFEDQGLLLIEPNFKLEELSNLPEILVFSLLNDLSLLDPKFFNLKSLEEFFLKQAFELVKKFIQSRIKKKSGNLIFLINSETDGYSYSDFPDSVDLAKLRNKFLSLQGGILGLTKTIQKEYNKRGIKSNCLSIDFNNLDLKEIIAAIDFSQENFGTAGHLFNLNLAKSL